MSAEVSSGHHRGVVVVVVVSFYAYPMVIFFKSKCAHPDIFSVVKNVFCALSKTP